MVPSAALLLALTALSTADGAEATPARARLVVSAPARCLTGADLARRVKARAPRVEFTDDATIVATVSVTASSAGTQLVELALVRPGEAPRPRVLKTGTCAEAADAVALILAVTLDPTSQPAPQRSTEGPAAGGPTPSPSADAAGPSPPIGATAPASRTPPPVRRTAPAAARPAPVARPTSPEAVPPPSASPRATPVVTAPAATSPAPAAPGLDISVAASAETLFGVAPRLLPGFALSAMIEARTDGVWAPALAVRWTHVWRSELSEANGAASFTLDAGALDACPLRWRWSLLAVRPCASLLVGRLASHGSGTAADGGDARPFSTAGLGVQARFGRTVEVAARLGVGVALLRDSYAFGDQVFYRAAPLTTSASLGLGFRWP